MKYQKGSATVWILIILVVIIIVGGIYWYLTQSSAQPATTFAPEAQNQTTDTPAPQGQTPTEQQQNTNTASQPANPTAQTTRSTESATIDRNSLTQAIGPTVTLSGMASGISSMQVSIIGSNGVVVAAPISGVQNSQVSDFQLSNGRWSVTLNNDGTVGPALQEGTYTVNIIDHVTGAVLATGTLTITEGSHASAPAGSSTYTNAQYRFSIQYPNTLTVNPSCTENNGPESCSNLSQNLISFYGAASQPANGFAYGYVLVATPSVVSGCASNPGNGFGTYSTQTINGISFGVYGTGSAAAGTQEETTTYSTEHNGLCYSITEDEYSYSGGTHIDQTKTNLESIVRTFHFTN